jgi:uncharacterized protein (DUF302 family)
MMQSNGLLRRVSKYPVDETVQRLKAAVAHHGLQLFALIDHSGEAEKVGLKMRPTKLLIFGSPKGGTPVMVASPSLAIDLPLKILVAEDEAGEVWITYNDPLYLQLRHGIPGELVNNIAGVGALAAESVE